MIVYFNKHGQIVEQLEYDSIARIGTNNFRIFAFFEDVNLVDYSVATIKFKRPDLQGNTYRGLQMIPCDFYYDSSIEESQAFQEANNPYKGYVFRFDDMIDNDTGEPFIMLDTQGVWQAVITLQNGIVGSNRNVVGQISFTVEGSRRIFIANAQELTDGVLEHSFNSALASKVDKNADIYIRYCDDFLTAAHEGTLLKAVYIKGCTVYDKANSCFYVIDEIQDNPMSSSLVYATQYRNIAIENVTNDDVMTLTTNQTVTGAKTFTKLLKVTTEDAGIDLTDTRNDTHAKLHKYTDCVGFTFDNGVSNPIEFTSAGQVVSTTGFKQKTNQGYLDLSTSNITFGLYGANGSVYNLASFITTTPFKGVVTATTDLPLSGNVSGDIYWVTNANTYYVWNGTSWNDIGSGSGSPVDLSNYYNKTESDARYARLNVSNDFTVPQIIDEKVIVHDVLDSTHEHYTEYKDKAIHIYRKNTTDSSVDSGYTLQMPSESGTLATREWASTNGTIYVNGGHNYPLTTKLEDVFEYFTDHNGRDYIRIITINSIDYIGNIHAGSNDTAIFDLTQIGNGYQNRYSVEYVSTNPSKTATFNDILVNTYQANFVVEEQAIKVLSSTTSPSGKSEVMFSKSNNAFYRKVNDNWQLINLGANSNLYGRVILSSENYSATNRNISAIIDNYTPVVGDLVIFLNGYLSTTPYGVKRIMARVTSVSSTTYNVDCPTNIQTFKEYYYDDTDFEDYYEDTRTLDTTDFDLIKSGHAVIHYRPNDYQQRYAFTLMCSYYDTSSLTCVYSGFDNMTYEIVELTISWVNGTGITYSVIRTPILKKTELDNRIFIPFVDGRAIWSNYGIFLTLNDLVYGNFDDTNQENHELTPNWNYTVSGNCREWRFYYLDNPGAEFWLVHLLKDTSVSPNKYYVYADCLNHNATRYVSYETTSSSELIDTIIDNNDVQITIGTITRHYRSNALTVSSAIHQNGTTATGSYDIILDVISKDYLSSGTNLKTMLFDEVTMFGGTSYVLKKNVLALRLNDSEGEFYNAEVIHSFVYQTNSGGTTHYEIQLSCFSFNNGEIMTFVLQGIEPTLNWSSTTLDY